MRANVNTQSALAQQAAPLSRSALTPSLFCLLLAMLCGPAKAEPYRVINEEWRSRWEWQSPATPSHRSVRAELPHTAPALGFDAEGGSWVLRLMQN